VPAGKSIWPERGVFPPGAARATKAPMALTLTDLRDLNGLGFDEIIDVRSPAEHEEDHVPGAISLPVLSNAERAQVGTIYTQESPFKARKIGAALVAQNAARHLQTHLADKPGAYRPLIYCWRGGQRSNSFASILSQIGWRAEVLAGGYKSYRRLVVRTLYDLPFPCPVLLLDGDTGSAKTDMLARLAQMGWQVLDLEGVARHRGSVLGGYADPQPAQKAFESVLAGKMAGFDPAQPVVVEAESSKVGNLNLPPALWTAMCAAPRLVLEVPRAARARYLLRAYDDVGDAEIAERLTGLHRQHGAAQLADWTAMLAEGRRGDLAASLMELHYDPLYRRARRGVGGQVLTLPETALDPDQMDQTAQGVSRALETLSRAGAAPVSG